MAREIKLTPLDAPASAYRTARSGAQPSTAAKTMAAIPEITNQYLEKMARSSALAQELEVSTQANLAVQDFTQWVDENPNAVDEILPEYEKRVEGILPQLSGIDRATMPLAQARIGRQLSDGRRIAMGVATERANKRVVSNLEMHGQSSLSDALIKGRELERWLPDYMAPAMEALAQGHLTQEGVDEFARSGIANFLLGNASMLSAAGDPDGALAQMQHPLFNKAVKPEDAVKLTNQIQTKFYEDTVNLATSMLGIAQATGDIAFAQEAQELISKLPPSANTRAIQNRLLAMETGVALDDFNAVVQELEIRDDLPGLQGLQGTTPEQNEIRDLAIARVEMGHGGRQRAREIQQSQGIYDKLVKEIHQNQRELPAEKAAKANADLIEKDERFKSLHITHQNAIYGLTGQEYKQYKAETLDEWLQNAVDLSALVRESMNSWGPDNEASIRSYLVDLMEGLDDIPGITEEQRGEAHSLLAGAARWFFPEPHPIPWNSALQDILSNPDAAKEMGLSPEEQEAFRKQATEIDKEVWRQHEGPVPFTDGNPEDRGTNLLTMRRKIAEIELLLGKDREHVSADYSAFIQRAASQLDVETIYTSGDERLIQAHLANLRGRGILNERDELTLLNKFAAATQLTDEQLKNYKAANRILSGNGQYDGTDPSNQGIFDILHATLAKTHGLDATDPNAVHHFNTAFFGTYGYLPEETGSQWARLWSSGSQQDMKAVVGAIHELDGKFRHKGVEALDPYLEDKPLFILQEIVNLTHPSNKQSPTFDQARTLAERQWEVFSDETSDRAQAIKKQMAGWVQKNPDGTERISETTGLPILTATRIEQVNAEAFKHLIGTGVSGAFFDTAIWNDLEAEMERQGVEWDVAIEPILEYWQDNFIKTDDGAKIREQPGGEAFMDFMLHFRAAMKDGYALHDGSWEGATRHAVDAMFVRGGWGKELDDYGGQIKQHPLSREPMVEGLYPSEYVPAAEVRAVGQNLFSLVAAGRLLMPDTVRGAEGKLIFPANWSGQGLWADGFDNYKEGFEFILGGAVADPVSIFQWGQDIIQEASKRSAMYSESQGRLGWYLTTVDFMKEMGATLMGLSDPKTLQAYMSLANIVATENYAVDKEGNRVKFDTVEERNKYLQEHPETMPAVVVEGVGMPDIALAGPGPAYTGKLWGQSKEDAEANGNTYYTATNFAELFTVDKNDPNQFGIDMRKALRYLQTRQLYAAGDIWGLRYRGNGDGTFDMQHFDSKTRSFHDMYDHVRGFGTLQNPKTFSPTEWAEKTLLVQKRRVERIRNDLIDTLSDGVGLFG